MIKTITNDELLSLNKTLNDLIVADVGDIKFKYAVIRNVKFIKDDVQTLLDVKKSSEAFNKYQKELYDLTVVHCELNDDKSLVLYINAALTIRTGKNQNTGLPKAKKGSEKVYAKAVVDLNVKNKKTIDANTKQVKDFNLLLPKKVTLTLYEIPLSYLESLKDLDYLALMVLSVLINDEK